MRIVRHATLAAALILALAATEARANPDVWVTTAITVSFEDRKVSRLAFAWSFDDFYSAHTIRTYDANRDGTLDAAEVAALRAGTFDPLARVDYHVHVWAGGDRREGHRAEEFTAKAEGERLVYAFSLPMAPALDPRDHAVTVSLFDPGTVVDFRFAAEDFLLVSGEMAAGCRFRIARGKGAQAGHPQPVTLACGG